MRADVWRQPPVKRLVAVSLVVTAVLVFPSAMPASIVIDGCIGRIGLWDGPSTALREWGKPIRTTKLASDPSFTVWHYKKGSVQFAPWRANRVVVGAIETTDPQQRTPAGIGVGSSQSELVAAHGRRTCRPNFHWCRIDSDANHRWTRVHLKNGRVDKVRMGLYSNYVDVGPEAPDSRCP